MKSLYIYILTVLQVLSQDILHGLGYAGIWKQILAEMLITPKVFRALILL